MTARRSPKNASDNIRANSLVARSTFLALVLTAIASFWAGVNWSAHKILFTNQCCPCSNDAHIDSHNGRLGKTGNLPYETPLTSTNTKNSSTCEILLQKCRQKGVSSISRAAAEERSIQQKKDSSTARFTQIQMQANRLMDAHKIGNMVAGMAVTSKVNFTDAIELGVPLDPIKPGDSHVLLLYNHKKAMPDSMKKHNTDELFLIPEIPYEEAVANCNMLNIWLVDHSKPDTDTCWALVPQIGSYHVQRWRRMNPRDLSKGNLQLSHKQPFRLSPRLARENGWQQYQIPKTKEREVFYGFLRDYFSSQEEIRRELKNTIDKNVSAFQSSSIIVMVCNYGQAKILTNFVCSARARFLDLSSVLVFATDKETVQVASSLGLATFYSDQIFSKVPAHTAVFGDKVYERMMLIKCLVSHLVSSLGYDFLFQDVDVVWYKDPLRHYFDQPWTKDFDIIFQDDGQHSDHFGPFHANSGFYFARNSDLTRSFFDAMLFAGDMIIASNSQQEAMAAVLSEQVSLYGLRVKVVPRESWALPTGWNFHIAKNYPYMKTTFLPNKHDSNKNNATILFHMSWTGNTDDKIKYFEQLGDWFVNETCMSEFSTSNALSSTDIVQQNNYQSCCLAEPIFKCHYRNKPSLRPCLDSPGKDSVTGSFW